MSAKTYEIRTINDLLKVPANRRAECLETISYSLDLHELAFGVGSETIGLDGIRWTDDGEMSVQLQDDKGVEIVTLRVYGGVASSAKAEPINGR